MDEPSESATLAYATGRGSALLSARAWHVLFWVAAVHLGLPLGLIGWAWLHGGLIHLLESVRGLPRDRPFPVAFIINLGIGPVTVAANALAVLGYRAGVVRASPRRWFLAYVPLQ